MTTPNYKPEDVPEEILKAAAEYANAREGWPSLQPRNIPSARKALQRRLDGDPMSAWGLNVGHFVDAEMAKRAKPTPPTWHPEDVPEDVIKAAVEYANRKERWSARPNDNDLARRVMTASSGALALWAWGRYVVEYVNAEMAKRQPPAPVAPPEDIDALLAEAAVNIESARQRIDVATHDLAMPNATTGVLAGHARRLANTAEKLSTALRARDRASKWRYDYWWHACSHVGALLQVIDEDEHTRPAIEAARRFLDTCAPRCSDPPGPDPSTVTGKPATIVLTPAPSPAPAVTVVYTTDALAAALRAILDYAWPDGTTGPACVRAARAALAGVEVTATSEPAPVTPPSGPREIDDALIREAVKFANMATHGSPLDSDVERVRDALENGVGGMWSACAVGYIRGATAPAPNDGLDNTPDYRALYGAEVEAHAETQAADTAKAHEIGRLKSALAQAGADLTRANDRIAGLQNRLDNIRAELADP